MRRIHPEQQCVIEEMAAKEKEKKFVQAVEALPEPVCAHDKAFILLVYKGLRPGMILPETSARYVFLISCCAKSDLR